METIIYRTRGDCAIKLDAYPAGAEKPSPVVVWIHGGALITGGRAISGGTRGWLRERLTRVGYTQFSIDYRLAPETKLPTIIADVQDAFIWIRQEGPRRFRLDPGRIGVIGHSAGGYLTLMTGFGINPRPRALVSYYGYGDIVGAWYSRPDPFYCRQPLVPAEEAYAAVGTAPVSELPPQHRRGHFYLYCRQRGLWPKEVAGMDPDESPDFFTPFCPVRNVTHDYPPTLLLHGTADTDVPYQQSADMAAELARHGVPHELITIPDGPHGFDGRVTIEEIAATATPAARSFHQVVGVLAAHL